MVHLSEGGDFKHHAEKNEEIGSTIKLGKLESLQQQRGTTFVFKFPGKDGLYSLQQTLTRKGKTERRICKTLKRTEGKDKGSWLIQHSKGEPVEDFDVQIEIVDHMHNDE